METIGRGTLVLVAGPSGAGKDSLLAGARAALGGEPAVLFARRTITRPPATGGEDHVAVSEADHQAARAAGAFALSWRAHGLHYGVGKEINEALARGRTVVVNVSRAIIDEARTRYSPACVVYVTVSPGVIEQRLRARGREDETAIALRLARAAAYDVPEGPDVYVVANDGPLADSTEAFVAVLRAIARG